MINIKDPKVDEVMQDRGVALKMVNGDLLDADEEMFLLTKLEQ